MSSTDRPDLATIIAETRKRILASREARDSRRSIEWKSVGDGFAALILPPRVLSSVDRVFADRENDEMALCDAVERLRAVVDALPRCTCTRPATREYPVNRPAYGAPGDFIVCDDDSHIVTDMARAAPYDLPYAAALRALETK